MCELGGGWINNLQILKHLRSSQKRDAREGGEQNRQTRAERWEKRESRSAIYVVYCKNCIIFPVGHIKSPIIRQLVTVTSSLLNKAFDNKVLTPQTRPEGTQGQRRWREKERGEFLQSHSQSSVTPSVSLPSDNFQYWPWDNFTAPAIYCRVHSHIRTMQN